MTVIALDYTPAYEQGGGIGRYVRELTSALAKRDQNTAYRLFVAGANSHSLPYSLGSNFTWRPTRLSPVWLARLWHRGRIPIPVETFVGQVALYHATDFVLPPTLPTTKTILTVHDLSFVRVPDSASPKLKRYLDKVVPYSVQRADYVLADSQATKNDLIELYEVSSEKVEVLLSGVDERFAPVKDTSYLLTIRSKYDIGNRPYILSVGTVQPRKNYSRLIQALGQLRADGYDIDLVIVGGRGWLEDPIYETIHTMHLQDFVHMIGFADDEDLPALYSDALCLALPSLYEGFGLPILEAMACGTPVITSNISSLPEVAGDVALLINPYDLDELITALKRMVDNQTLRQDFARQGLERVKQFTWDASASHLSQIYAKLLAYG